MVETIDKSWRQPIPVNLKVYTGGNVFAATVLMELLRRCANKPMDVSIGDTWTHLERGQCICGRFELAAHFGMKRKEAGRVQRILKRLENSYKLINKRKAKDCSIVTVNNYDQITSLNIRMFRTRSNHERSTITNNSVKSDKSDKKKKIFWKGRQLSRTELEKIVTPEELKEIDFKDKLWEAVST